MKLKILHYIILLFWHTKAMEECDKMHIESSQNINGRAADLDFSIEGYKLAHDFEEDSLATLTDLTYDVESMMGTCFPSSIGPYSRYNREKILLFPKFYNYYPFYLQDASNTIVAFMTIHKTMIKQNAEPIILFEIYDLCVRKEERRKGLASKFIKLSLDTYRNYIEPFKASSAIISLQLSVKDEMMNISYMIYRKLGFRNHQLCYRLNELDVSQKNSYEYWNLHLEKSYYEYRLNRATGDPRLCLFREWPKDNEDWDMDRGKESTSVLIEMGTKIKNDMINLIFRYSTLLANQKDKNKSI